MGVTLKHSSSGMGTQQLNTGLDNRFQGRAEASGKHLHISSARKHCRAAPCLENKQRPRTWNQTDESERSGSTELLKDTVLVAVLGVLLHLLQVLLVTLQAPGVVFERWCSVAAAVLQPVMQPFGLLQRLQLHVVLQLVGTERHKRFCLLKTDQWKAVPLITSCGYQPNVHPNYFTLQEFWHRCEQILSCIVTKLCWDIVFSLTSCPCLFESCCNVRCPQAVRTPSFWASYSSAHSPLRGLCFLDLLLGHCSGGRRSGKGFLRHRPRSWPTPHLTGARRKALEYL